MKQFLILLILLSVAIGYSQETRKETIVKDGVENNLTSTVTDMYDGTESEIAKKFFDKASDFGFSGDNKKAEVNYLKAIEHDPEFVEAYDNLGRVYRSMGNYDKAIEYYKKSIEMYPSGQMAHQNLAVVYGIQKDYIGALKEYQALLEINENDPESYFGMANTYMMLQKFDDALTNANKALEIYKEKKSDHLADGYYLIGLIHYYKGNREDAKKNLILAKENGAKINSQIAAEFKI